MPKSLQPIGRRRRFRTKSCLADGATLVEGYKLSPSDAINIEASDEAGLFNAIQTLRQLLPADQTERERRSKFRGTIEDAQRLAGGPSTRCLPSFLRCRVRQKVHRPVAHKMNIFHWHLTEDQDGGSQSMRIQGWPKLHQGESTPLPDRTVQDGKPYGGIYTKDDIREVLPTLTQGITVLPEIELPGHTIAVLAAYPELDVVVKGMFAPNGASKMMFSARNDAVFEFLENVLMKFRLFPSEYIHIGGDECPRCVERMPRRQARMEEEELKDEEELQAGLSAKLNTAQQRRKMIGWEILEGDYLKAQGCFMARNRRGHTAAKQGHEVVRPVTHCYLITTNQKIEKMNRPPFSPDPRRPARAVGLALLAFYLSRPFTDLTLVGVPAEYHNFVIGGQSNLGANTSHQMNRRKMPTHGRGYCRNAVVAHA